MNDNIRDYEQLSEQIEELVVNNQGFTSIADLLQRRYSPEILRYEEASWREGTYIDTPNMKVDLEKLNKDLSEVKCSYSNVSDKYLNLILKDPLEFGHPHISVSLEKFGEDLYLQLGTHGGNEEIEIKNQKEVEECYGDSLKAKKSGREGLYHSFPIKFGAREAESKSFFPHAFKFLFSNPKLRGIKKAYSELMSVAVGDISFEESDLEHVGLEEWLEHNERVALRYPLRILLASNYIEEEPFELPEANSEFPNLSSESNKENFPDKNHNGRKLYLPAQKRKETREALEEEWKEVENIPFSFIGGNRAIEGVLNATEGMKNEFGDEFVETVEKLEKWGKREIEDSEKEVLKDNFAREEDFEVVRNYMDSLLEEEGWLERNEEYGEQETREFHDILVIGIYVNQFD